MFCVGLFFSNPPGPTIFRVLRELLLALYPKILVTFSGRQKNSVSPSDPEPELTQVF